MVKLKHTTIEERILSYLMSRKVPAASIANIRELILQESDDEVDIDELMQVIENLIRDNVLEWVERDTLTVKVTFDERIKMQRSR